MDSKFGKMAQSMMVSGKEIKQMVMVLSFMLTVMFMKGSGITIKLMDMVHINTLMAQLMSEIGLKINNMAKV